MKRKTHTFYKLNNGKWRSDARKLSVKTLKKFGAVKAEYKDIDAYAPSRGYFNARKVLIVK